MSNCTTSFSTCFKIKAARFLIKRDRLHVAAFGMVLKAAVTNYCDDGCGFCVDVMQIINPKILY